jgi:hypothetical protein
MNFGSIFFFYRFLSVTDFLCYRQEFESPAGEFPASVLAAFERHTQGKNRAEQSFSLPQFPSRVSLAEYRISAWHVFCPPPASGI